MPSFKTICKKYFGTSNFYDILKVDADASETAIKKAYHRLSLLVHPDRVEESEKEIATEKFKVLGKIHSVLQDKLKRKLYDDFGACDEDIDLSFNWMGYWQTMFKKIAIADIRKFEKAYIGSETERRDIKQAYVISKGNMDSILEMVPFSSCDSERRIKRIVKKMVRNGEVKKHYAFFNESKLKRARRRKKWEKEKRETASVSMRDLEMEMERSLRRREKRFEKLVANVIHKYSIYMNKKRKRSVTDIGSTMRTGKKKTGYR